MPRKGSVERRQILADPKYRDPFVAKFINMLMRDGEKNVAEGIVYDALKRVSEKAHEEPVNVFRKALDNVRPVVEVRSRRVGGATYQVPVEVRPQRRTSLAMRWIVFSARSRAGKSMEEKLTGELLDAANNRGGAVKKKEDTHRMAEANRAFAHYRW